MVGIFKDRSGSLRNGWWILLFYMALAALVVPAAIHASSTRSEVHPWLQAALVVVATSVCLVLRREGLSSIVGPAGSWAWGVPAGLASGIAIWGTVAAWIWLLGAVEWQWGVLDSQVLLAGLVDCLSVAVVEELVFRGFAFQRLVDGVGAWAAQILMGGYFVLTHSAGLATAGDMRLLAAANVFIASLLFGAAYLRTRSLALPMALHFALNFIQGPLLGFGVSGNRTDSVLVPVLAERYQWWSGGSFGLEASIPGTVAISLALVAMLTWGRWSSGRASSNTSDCKAGA